MKLRPTPLSRASCGTAARRSSCSASTPGRWTARRTTWRGSATRRRSASRWPRGGDRRRAAGRLPRPARRGRGDYLVLLNNDTVVTAGWLTYLVGLAELAPEVGLVGPMSNGAAPPQRVEQVPYRLGPRGSRAACPSGRWTPPRWTGSPRRSGSSTAAGGSRPTIWAGSACWSSGRCLRRWGRWRAGRGWGSSTPTPCAAGAGVRVPAGLFAATCSSTTSPAAPLPRAGQSHKSERTEPPPGARPPTRRISEAPAASSLTRRASPLRRPPR